jgi:hypothetical protein
MKLTTQVTAEDIFKRLRKLSDCDIRSITFQLNGWMSTSRNAEYIVAMDTLMKAFEGEHTN